MTVYYKVLEFIDSHNVDPVLYTPLLLSANSKKEGETVEKSK